MKNSNGFNYDEILEQVKDTDVQTYLQQKLEMSSELVKDQMESDCLKDKGEKMKILEPYIEITIISEEEKVYKRLKIISNSACNSEIPNAQFKINGNQFLKVLEHYKKYVADYATKATNDMFDLCNIKFEYNEEFYNFSFDYNNSELLELATKMYKDFKDVIIFSSIDYEDIEWNIVREIKSLPLKTKFVLDDYFKKYGIISKDDKNWLCNNIKKQINDFVEINKKPFKPIYLCESIKI